jgi:VWFA-related protein
MTRTVHLVSVLCAAAIGAAVLSAQESENGPLATFFAPVEVPLVSIEVFVSDGSGRPMPGLSLDDFEIFEDGMPVTISHFYASPGVTESFVSTAGTRTEAGEESAPNQDLFLLIYFDDTNLSRGRRQSAIEHLRGFLSSELPPDLMVMLVRYDGGLHIEREFTDETDDIIRALDAMQVSASLSTRIEEGRMLREMENATTATAIYGEEDAFTFLEVRGASLLQEIDSYSDRTFQRTRTGLDIQQRLIRSLSGLGGRKAMLVVSDGVEVRPGEMLYRAWGETFGSVPALSVDAQRAFLLASRNDLGHEFEEHARFANGHRVSFFNLSAAGVARQRASSAETRLADTQGLLMDQGMSEDATMAYVAGVTGGRTLVNSPALSGQLDEVSVELGSYYSLAFEPRHLGDGKYHRLDVRVQRDGARARHREGYLDLPQSERMINRTLAAAVHGIAENPLGVRVTNGELTPRDDGTYLVPIIITVPIGQLVLIPSEDEHEGRISILLTVRDQNGDISQPQRREYPVPVRNADLTAALNQSAGFTLRLAVRPGRQRIAVGVRDEIAQVESVTTLDVETGGPGGLNS